MKKNKTADLSEQELIAKINRRWKKAENFEEIEKRVRAFPLHRSSQSLTAIKHMFYSCPELFLFNEVVDNIKSKYLASQTYMYNNAGTQIENMNNAVLKLIKTAHVLYPDFEEMKEKQGQQENQTTVKEKNKMEQNKTERGSRRISDKLKMLLCKDETLIAFFFEKDDDELLKYFKKQNIYTVSDYFKADLKVRARIYRAGYATYQDKYDTFRTKFNKYVDEFIENKENVELQNTTSTKNNETVENSTEMDLQTEQEKTNINNEIKFESPEEFFEYLEQLPAENFVKSSKTMNNIAKLTQNILAEQIEPYIQADMSEEDLTTYTGDLISKYHLLVDKKRAEDELNKRQSANRSSVQKLLSDGVKYYRKPSEQRVDPLVNEIGTHKNHPEREF